nr:unnamed protein product [Callosobruchus analis]
MTVIGSLIPGIETGTDPGKETGRADHEVQTTGKEIGNEKEGTYTGTEIGNETEIKIVEVEDLVRVSTYNKSNFLNIFQRIIKSILFFWCV